MVKHVDTAMIMAAGKGTRMMPLTADRPKPLIEVSGIALLDHVLGHLRDAGVGKIVVNVHYRAEQIEQHLAASAADLDVRISDERDVLRDTGGGLVHAFAIFRMIPLFASTPIIGGPMRARMRSRSLWRIGMMPAWTFSCSSFR